MNKLTELEKVVERLETFVDALCLPKIGRASCRERV